MKSYQPLIISLLVHLCLYLLAQSAPSENLFEPRPQEVEIVYQNETKPKQFVTDPNEAELEKAIQKLKDTAEKLSRVTRRVKEEIAARANGRTQNRPAKSISKISQELKAPLDPNAPSISKPMPNQVVKNTHTGDSSLAEFIPEVKVGGFTALNTDQFVHYTFYARTNEQVRNRWIALIRNFINNTAPSELNRLAQQPQVSQVEIVLDPKGRFIKSIVHQHSQNPDVDQYAIEAFRQAAPFNNPPEEMIEADGFIHLHYAFHIHFRPRYIASGSQ